MAAVREGRCVEATVGSTTASGLVMGTRSGDLDPCLGWFLNQAAGISPQQFHRMVNHESGMRGVSEVSSDLRGLHAKQHDKVRAAEAIALFA
jgi:acetate kinase